MSKQIISDTFTPSNPLIKSSDPPKMSDIPSRVIVNKIFPFFKYSLTKEDLDNKYSHFGYFKTDRFRKIFFLFRSTQILQIGQIHHPNPTPQYLDCERLISLQLYNPKMEFISNLLSVTHRMRSLERLEIGLFHTRFINPTFSFSYVLELRSLFSSPNGFPELRHFKIENIGFNDRLLDYDWEISEKSKVFERLETLFISDGGYNERPVHFSEHNTQNIIEKIGPNLKRLRIGTSSSPNFILPRKTTLKLPKIEHLCYSPHPNCPIQTGNNLKTLDFQLDSELDSNFIRNSLLPDLREVYRKSTRLEVIKLIEDTTFEVVEIAETLYYDSWLFKPEINPLEHVKKISVETMSVDVCFVSRLKIFAKTLEEFHFFLENEESEIVEELPFLVEFPHLKIIDLRCSFPLATGPWKMFENVENLSLGVRGKSKLGDEMFQMTNFKKLVRFDINCCHVQNGLIRGEGWRKMENLEYLMISDTDSLTDALFHEERFPLLNSLAINECPLVEGKGWNAKNFVGLKELSLYALPKLQKDLFVKGKGMFKNLLELELELEM